MTTTKPYRVGEDGPRMYEIDGVAYPSVTTVLSVISKPALVPWATNMALANVEQVLRDSGGPPTLVDDGYGDWVSAIVEAARKTPMAARDKAADVGTRAHAAIEASILGQEPMLTPDIATAHGNFFSWLKESGLAIVDAEQVVVSKQHGYAGTRDFLAKRLFDGALFMGDIKTSNGLYPEYLLQVAAYAAGHQEMVDNLDGAIEGTVLVRVGKTDPTDQEVRWRSEAEWQTDFFNGFLPALELWNYLHPVKVRKEKKGVK